MTETKPFRNLFRSTAAAVGLALTGTFVLAGTPPAGAGALASCRLDAPSSSPPAALVTGLDVADDGTVVTVEQAGVAASARVVLHHPDGEVEAPVALASFDAHVVEVAVSGDGRVLHLTSTANPLSTNGDQNRELFRWSADDGLEQITFTVGGGDSAHRHPDVDAHGEHATVLTNRTVDGANTDGNAEVARVDDAGQPTLLTSTTGASMAAPAISPDGTTIAFGSRTSQLPGTLNADGSAELFRSAGGLLFQQLTSTGGGTIAPSPSIAADGTIAFDLNTSQLGTNPDGGSETYLRHPDGTIEQLTNTTDGGFDHPDVNPAGTAVTFRHNTNGSPLPAVRWARTGGTTELGVLAPSSPDPAIDATGSRIGFVAAGPQLVRADCRTFTDVDQDHPFWGDVEWMSGEGTTTGYADGTYRAAAPVSRAAMSAFLYRIAGAPPFADPAFPSFTDVNAGHPFFTEVEWMSHAGISTGYADQTYRPDAPVTRGAMSAFLYRLEAPGYGTPDTAHFHDVPTDHPFFAEVEWMGDMGITTGYADGTFRPGAAVTRQAMSAFLHRLVDPPWSPLS
jgi:Tol biopolymer transport system component